MKRLIYSVLVLSLAACAQGNDKSTSDTPASDSPNTPSASPTPSRSLRNGFWGSDTARLEVGDRASHLELGCAHGDIPQKIVLSDQNTFSVNGTFTREGGAEPSGGFPSYPAHYDGTVQGSTMHLNVLYTIGGEAFHESFDLAYGVDRLPMKCRSSAMTWTAVTEKTTCEALNPMFCKGLYGFSVDRAGMYSIGPNRTGDMRTGHVTSAELTGLSVRAEAVSRTAEQSRCFNAQRLPGSSDTVTLYTTHGGFAAYDWQGTLGRVCLRGQTAAARSLHSWENALMRKYYPSQF